MKLGISDKVIEFITSFDVPIYVVGGKVRNALMGIDEGDWDVCSSLTPEELIRLAKSMPEVKVIPRALEFGTVEIHIDGITLEHTTFRTDSYGKGGWHRPNGVAFTDSIEKDALRRDFRINSIYYDIILKKFIDPLDGISDIKKRVIRTADIPQKTLSEDGLRIMRMVRLACELGFNIEEETFLQAKEMVSNLRDIAKERIRDELSLLLLSDTRYPMLDCGLAHKRGLKMLNELGALEFILPGLEEGRCFRQREEYHVYDVLDHSIETCGYSPPDIALRLAALLHDIAKPRAKIKSGEMYGHEVLGEKMARGLLGANGLKYPQKVVEHVCRLVRNHMYDLNGETSVNKVRRMIARMGKNGSKDLIELRKADILGSGRAGSLYTVDKWTQIRDEMIFSNAPFSLNELDITGEDIIKKLKIPPGRDIGRIKEHLFFHCLDYPRDNNKNKLLQLAYSYARNLKRKKR